MRGKNRGRGGVLRAVRHAGTDSGAACAGTTLAGTGAAGGPACAGAVCGFKGCNSHSHMPCSRIGIQFSREWLPEYVTDCDVVLCRRYNLFPGYCRIFRAALLPDIQAFRGKGGQELCAGRRLGFFVAFVASGMGLSVRSPGCARYFKKDMREFLIYIPFKSP